MRLLHKGNKRMGMKLGFKPVVFTVAVFALSATCPVRAATILNDSGVGDYQILAYQPIGQSFTAIDSDLLSIGFAFTNINPLSLNASITLNLVTGDGTGGASVATRTFTLSDADANSTYFPPASFYDVDFSGTPLTIGAMYTALLSTTTDRWGVTSNGNTYGGGQIYISGIASPLGDLTFRVIGETPPAVPLPTALPLLATGLGVLGLFGWRRKRKAAVLAA
jgi:hypothetical protein